MKSNRHHLARFRLRTVFIIVAISALLLPIGSVLFFRIYENELVRQTERELIAQAVFIAASYKHSINTILNHGQLNHKTSYGIKIQPQPQPQPEPPQQAIQIDDSPFHIVTPAINLNNSEVLPPRPDGIMTAQKSDKAALEAGRRVSVIMADAQKTTLAGMKIVDTQGIVVAGKFEIGQSFQHLPEIQHALQGNYQSLLRQRISDAATPALASISRGTGIRLFIAFPIIDNDRVLGAVYLSRTPENVLKHLYAEKEKVLAISGLILCLTIFIGFFTSRMISRPIHHLIDKIKQVSGGDQTAIAPLNSPGTLEIQALSESFMSMATNLFERMNYLREFAMYLSHEFKTPVTSIQGSAELLLDHFNTMSDSEREKFLTNILSDSHRLQHLVTRLLDLAKADNVLPNYERTDLESLIIQLTKDYQTKNLSIITDDLTPTAVSISADHLTMVFQNLLDNAKEHGAREVRINIQTTQNQLTIHVIDNGEGISKANQSKLFTPFFTTKRETNGTGLGLIIVKSLLEKHDGTICLSQNQSETGAHFIIKLPLSTTLI